MAAADSPAAAAAFSGDPKPPASDPSNPSLLPAPPSSAVAAAENPSSGHPNPNPNLPGPPTVVLPSAIPPPLAPSFTPSFRPLGAPPPPPSPYGAMPNHAFQMPPAPGVVPVGAYQAPPGQPMGSAQMPVAYMPAPNAYMPVPSSMPPQGVIRYPAPYPTIMRPPFPMRPVAPVGMVPTIQRPPIPGIRPAVVTPMMRPPPTIVTPVEKPQTTVYISKISPTVDNDFLLSLLRICGPVKSWKRPQDPADGTFKSFGFCEFETAEGILRALRLISKMNLDGQELALNINQATREYLEKYIQKKNEREKAKEAENEGGDKGSEEPGNEKEPSNSVPDGTSQATESGAKETEEDIKKFGIVTSEDREADDEAIKKITDAIEERKKAKPPPPPPQTQSEADSNAKARSQTPLKSKDGDSDADALKSDAAEDRNGDDSANENRRTVTDNDKHEISSHRRRRERSREREKSKERDVSRERDRERDLKREKERELERYELERERERIRRERDREYRHKETERAYNDRAKDWEARERDKEYNRQLEKDREKERERERKREISKQEEESDDEDYRKRRHRSSILEERRRKRQMEKENDMADRLKEEEELAAEAKRFLEEQQKREELSSQMEVEQAVQADTKGEMAVVKVENRSLENGDIVLNGSNAVEPTWRNNSGEEKSIGSVPVLDIKSNNNIPTKKLGFGLIGSGKRTSVPSVFAEEDDGEDDEKKLRPLVPIDYSTDELQAIQSNASGGKSNTVAGAEFGKQNLATNVKDEKPETDKERRRISERSARDRERTDGDGTRGKDESKAKTKDRSHDREKDREDKAKSENKKVLDAKQLIDTIPRTREELFNYDVNWVIYDKHELHERMRPWISKKITEFLGEEEATLVDYIVSCTRDHVHASKMLELIQSILDDEAEMFVLKMWRMLIFEIKKVETGLSVKTKG